MFQRAVGTELKRERRGKEGGTEGRAEWREGGLGLGPQRPAACQWRMQ